MLASTVQFSRYGWDADSPGAYLLSQGVRLRFHGPDTTLPKKCWSEGSVTRSLRTQQCADLLFEINCFPLPKGVVLANDRSKQVQSMFHP
jgi:hypothetical protein